MRHTELWGNREHKYEWLSSHDIGDTPWIDITPTQPYYFFTPNDGRHRQEYEQSWYLPSIFRLNGDPAPGIVTTHDDFAISWTEEEAIAKVSRLLATANEDDARQVFQLCTQEQWNYARAKRELADGRWRNETRRMYASRVVWEMVIPIGCSSR